MDKSSDRGKGEEGEEIEGGEERGRREVILEIADSQSEKRVTSRSGKLCSTNLKAAKIAITSPLAADPRRRKAVT